MKSKHPVPRCCHPLPSLATFPANPKKEKEKKKKIRPLGVAGIHPNGQGREIRPTPVAIFVFSANDKKRKEKSDRSSHDPP
jgi:hypothetical protein